MAKAKTHNITRNVRGNVQSQVIPQTEWQANEAALAAEGWTVADEESPPRMHTKFSAPNPKIPKAPKVPKVPKEIREREQKLAAVKKKAKAVAKKRSKARQTAKKKAKAAGRGVSGAVGDRPVTIARPASPARRR